MCREALQRSPSPCTGPARQLQTRSPSPATTEPREAATLLDLQPPPNVHAKPTPGACCSGSELGALPVTPGSLDRKPESLQGTRLESSCRSQGPQRTGARCHCKTAAVVALTAEPTSLCFTSVIWYWWPAQLLMLQGSRER